MSLPHDRKLILLDVWPPHICSHSDKPLIAVLLVAAKCLIANRWKLSTVPSLQQWYSKVWDVATADKLVDSILCSETPNLNENSAETWFSFFFFCFKICLCQEMDASQVSMFELVVKIVYFYGSSVTMKVLIFCITAIAALFEPVCI